MEATSAPPILLPGIDHLLLLPGIDHLPCLQELRSVKDKPFYCQSSVGTLPFGSPVEATSAPPILLPGIDHLPCLQEIRSVKDKPFYCQSSVGTIPFQGRVFLVLPFCKQNASLLQLLSQLLIPGPSLIRSPLAICEQRLCAASAQSGSWGHTLRGLALQLLVCRQRACACYHLQARPLVGCPGKTNPHVEPLCR